MNPLEDKSFKFSSGDPPKTPDEPSKTKEEDVRVSQQGQRALKAKTNDPELAKWSELHNDTDLSSDFSNSLEQWIVPTPMGTPLSELVVFKNEYRGQIPLNGIKENEFIRVNQILKDIADNKTHLQVEGREEFRNFILKNLGKICTREVGRNLLDRVMKGSDYEGKIELNVYESKKALQFQYTNFSYFGLFTYKKLSLPVDMQAMMFGVLNKSEKVGEPENKGLKDFVLGLLGYSTTPNYENFYTILPHIALAHELTHVAHFYENRALDRGAEEPSLNKDLDNMEEQVTITGVEKHPIFYWPKDDEIKAMKEGDQISLVDGVPMFSYDPVNERRFGDVFGSPTRTNHVGGLVYIDDRIVDNSSEVLTLLRDFNKHNSQKDLVILKEKIEEHLKEFINSERVFDPRKVHQHAIFVLEISENEPFAKTYFDLLIDKGIEIEPDSEFAKEIDYSWGSLGCSIAAQKGRLDILKWIKKNDANWDKRTCLEAIKNGHLELLKWAFVNGAPLSKEDALSIANPTPEIAAWIQSNLKNMK